MEKPIRIQRKRTKGWKMPENTIYVGRGSKWGNPYKIDTMMSRETCLQMYGDHLKFMEDEGCFKKQELKGKNLACWCSLNESCHADKLLTWANDF